MSNLKKEEIETQILICTYMEKVLVSKSPTEGFFGKGRLVQMQDCVQESLSTR